MRKTNIFILLFILTSVSHDALCMFLIEPLKPMVQPVLLAGISYLCYALLQQKKPSNPGALTLHEQYENALKEDDALSTQICLGKAESPSKNEVIKRRQHILQLKKALKQNQKSVS